LHSRSKGRAFLLSVFFGGLLAFVSPGAIIINEIHYDPDVKTEPAEFVELYNNGSSTGTLSGWQLSGAVTYTIPNGVTLAPGAYLVIAQEPATILSKFGVNALGPWLGKLGNEGETIELRNAAGAVEDEVDYQIGFPWPTVGDSPGYSIELINPTFDNDLGGNWRASVVGNPQLQTNTLVADHSSWKYFKGYSEASSPTTAWRALSFNDSAWPTGNGIIGFGESASFLSTILSDMRSNYTTVFFRKAFVVTNLAQINALVLQAVYDDGFKVWINGSNVLNANISSGEVPYTNSASSALEDLTYKTFNLNAPQTYLANGTNIIAVQAANSSLTTSSDFFFDMRLFGTAGPPTRGPTPGRINSVYATNAAPQMRQVDHDPEQPKAGQPVTITVKVTDAQSVTSVTLQYQLVDAGNYIELTDPAYASNWTPLAMNDSGTNGDAQAGDSIYTVALPSSVQVHRRLVRYRITATDGTGLTIRAPYEDDPQPNFAYFVYNGVPAWTGEVRPGITGTFTVSSNEMNRLPVYHLIGKSNSIFTAMGWNPGAPNNRYGGDNYLWLGTLVYDGEVYDHIGYRMRGGVWRYAMGKNAWKFAFNRGHNFQARDDWGRKYNTLWRRLSFRADIQQGDYQHRGEQGMFESVGYKLFRLAGVDSPQTTHVQFRIIDGAAEATAGNQYFGDFWGLYLAVEEQDGRFLDERGLPDGNVYDMESGSGTLNNIGPDGPLDKSDLNAFLSTYNNTNNGSLPDSWWRTNLNLPQYYSYQAVLQGFHHYDIADGKNYFYYLNPVLGQWTVWPWDLDLSWSDNMYRAGSGGGDEPFKSRVLSNFSSSPARPVLYTEFRNRVREIRDLLFNMDQGFALIDEMAALIRGPAGQPSVIDADRAQWDYNPVMVNTNVVNLNKAGHGRFYQWPLEPSVSKDFSGCAQLMKNYVVYRATSANLGGGVAGLDGLAADALIPAPPTITYTGPTNFPITQLTFSSSAYSGSYPFEAMNWRVGEVTDTNAPGFDPTEPHPYEITAVWESGELTSFNADITIPDANLRIGHAYRARVRMKDTTGRWSSWSTPIQFVVGESQGAAALLSNLRVTELMYAPPAGSEFEFVELHNSGASTLNLGGAKFTSGIDFTFPGGTTMLSGTYLVLIKTNEATFRARYNLSPTVPLIGPYSGSLNNAGEEVTLKTASGGATIASFTYGNGRGWPVQADGAGHSLVPVAYALANGQATGSLDYPGNWRGSSYIGGSPGRADPTPLSPVVLLNEIVAHTDYSDPSRPEYDSNDWIEFVNLLGAPATLDSNWYLSDDPAVPKKWQFSSATIPANGFLVLDEVGGFHNPIANGFGLDKAGEQVLLSYMPGTADDRVVDVVEFKGQENGVSLSRYADGGQFWYATVRSSNAPNATPIPGIVLSEVQYHPPDIGTNDNTQDEFVELFNPTGAPITLQNTNGVWRLDGGIGFTFPTNVTLAANARLLVVNFDPAITSASNNFRTLYGITNPAVRILGPYSGKLGNRSDRVALEKPQYPDLVGDPYSWVIVDEAIYGNQTPWPTAANGGGASLQRVSSSQSGNDPANWVAGSPTAGANNTGEILVPQPPAQPVATPGEGQVVLAWSASGFATSYHVKRATNTGGPYATIAVVTTTNYLDVAVTNGVRYYYVVSAANSAGESVNSAEVNAMPQQFPPAAPTGLTAFARNSEIALSWNVVSGAASYNVKRSTNSSGPYTTVASGVVSVAYTDTGLANGTTYYYVVSGVNAAGEGPNSTQVPATPRAAPTSSQYSKAVIALSPLAYWPLNDTADPASGSAPAYDYYYSALSGTYGSAAQNGFNGIAGPRPADGFSIFETTNAAAQFANGVANSYVTVPPLGINTNALTITAWINPTAIINFSGIVFYRSGGGSASGLNVGAGYLGYHWNDQGPTYNFNSGITIPTDQWSFVALAVEPAKATLYLINTSGTQAATNVTAHANRAFSSTLRIGGDPGSNARIFPGSIDEVAVFPYTLTLGQIQDLYNAVTTPPTDVTLTIQRSGGNVILTWPQGTLQHADNVSGPYSNVGSAISPYNLTPAQAKKFYRVLVQ
jgi:hypothetical protein